MQCEPEVLHIARGNPMAAIRAFVIQLMPFLPLPFVTITRLSAHGLDWICGFLLFFCVFVAYALVAQVRAFMSAFDSDAPYLTMDSSGLAVLLPMQQSWRWWDVVACACKNEKERRVLRVFLSDSAKIKIDIDFALAAEPKRSLDEAMVACAAWIAASRDPSITKSPIREFADKPARSSWASRAPKPAVKGVITVFVVLSLVAVCLISAVSTVREERRCRSTGAGSPHFYDWCEASPIRPSR